MYFIDPSQLLGLTEAVNGLLTAPKASSEAVRIAGILHAVSKQELLPAPPFQPDPRPR